MSDELLAKVRERVWAQLHRVVDSEVLQAKLDAVMADVETALVLARREAYAESMRCMAREGTQGADAAFREQHAAYLYPLPTRTRQVLREEPVPGTRSPFYRWHNGRLEFLAGRAWGSSSSVTRNDDGHVPLMRHALDLHDNPYRTEQVPADERDPWGET